MGAENFQVLIELGFFGRLQKWDDDSRIEVDVLQSLLREYGADCLKDLRSICTIAAEIPHPDGKPHWTEFWYKLRGSWTFFVLEERLSGVFILHDRARR